MGMSPQVNCIEGFWWWVRLSVRSDSWSVILTIFSRRALVFYRNSWFLFMGGGGVGVAGACWLAESSLVVLVGRPFPIPVTFSLPVVLTQGLFPLVSSSVFPLVLMRFAGPFQDELKVVDLLDHGKECFHLELLVHWDLGCFWNPPTAASIRRENFLFPIALERNLWPLNPMVGIWDLIERHISVDFVHHVHELTNMVKNHWTRLKWRDDLFERLPGESIEQLLNKMDLN